MRVNKRYQLDKLGEIEKALNDYSSNALFLAIQNLSSNDDLVKKLEKLSYLLTDCQDQANSIIYALNNSNKQTSQLETELQGAYDEK